MAGLTFDTGELIALERRKHRLRQVFSVAVSDGTLMTLPAPVVTAWWRAATALRRDLLAAVEVEPLDEALARAAGEALESVPGATGIDAIVMASAARRATWSTPQTSVT